MVRPVHYTTKTDRRKDKNTMTIKYNLHYKHFASKPTAEDVRALRYTLGRSDTETTPEELIQAVENGQTFTPAYMTGSKSTDWKSQQIFVVDVDNDNPDKTIITSPMTPGLAVQLYSYYGLEPYFVYYTFSNTPEHPKFRLVFILETPLTDPTEAEDLNGRLTDVLNRYTDPEKCADTSINDNARLIYGSHPGSVFITTGNYATLQDLRELPPKAVERPLNASEGPTLGNYADNVRSANNGNFDLIPLLDYIDADDYEIWLKVGMALYTEGYTVNDWDTWSRKSAKYNPGDCYKKWDTFDGSKPINGGYITNLAKRSGYIPPKDLSKPTPWTPPEHDIFDEPPETTETLETATALDEFLAEIQTERYKPIPTGIRQLDDALDGGFERKTLVTLSSAPGMGKTAISQYIFENMAKEGHNVVYVNLEMDRSQLLSRSVSRIAFEQTAGKRQKTAWNTWEEVASNFNLSTTVVRRGYKWTDEQRTAIYKAVDYYRENIAPRFQYVTTNPDNSGHISNELSEILGKLEDITEGMLASGSNAPLVCIDYLQFIECDITADGELLADTNEKKPDTAEAIKRILQALKLFAMKYSTVVYVIMANNRTANQEGRASMDSGRDTSNIEYSGDVMLSLVYTAIEDKWQVPKKKDKDGNSVYGSCDLEFINGKIDYCRKEEHDDPLISKLQSMKVVKGRGIRGRGVARFVYNGKYSTFDEDNGIQNPYKQD